MIQHGTFLKITDNSGARRVLCIKVLKGYRRRYAKIGDCVICSIKKLRKKRRAFSKTKKGGVHKALIIQVKCPVTNKIGDSTKFFRNSAILLTKNNKLIGTRIFGLIPKTFRQTKFIKLIFMSVGTA